MSGSQAKCALTVLRWSLGIVVLIEAILFVLPSAAHEFTRTHMPGFVRLLLGWGEIVGSILLLFRRRRFAGRGCCWRCSCLRS